MGRVIDADAFDERVRLDVGLCEEELTEDFKDGISTVLEMMKTAPTVEAVPVRHGRWTIEDFHVAPHLYCCSNCTAYHRARYAYCPSCGAVMDGKDGEGRE